MKKLLLAVLVLSCFLTGCKKQCGGFRYMSNETPALKKNDYNSCRAICENLTYLVCGNNYETDFPYWDNDGDTIMVCGYLYEDWDGNRNDFILFDSPNNANEHTICVNVQNTLQAMPEEIDISKKCYIKGHLYFRALHLGFGSYPIVPFVYDVYDVYFEE